MDNPFSLPAVTPQTTRAIRAAASYVAERMRARTDARDIIKGLERHHGAKQTHPGYRTALRCGGIYSEAAASCDLLIAEALIQQFADKAALYLAEAGSGDLVDQMEADHG